MIWCNTFPKLIKEEWIRAASVAAVNFHSAPLPEYRGVFAFNFAILNGGRRIRGDRPPPRKEIRPRGHHRGEALPVRLRQGERRRARRLSEEKMLELFRDVYKKYRSGEPVLTMPQEPDGGRYFSRSDFEEAKRIVPGEDPAMTE